MNLKKIGATVLSGVFASSILATGVFAQTTAPKDTGVTLQLKQIYEVVHEGDTVDLEALTMKKGSGYDVDWDVTGYSTNGTPADVDSNNYELTEGITNLVSLPIEGTDELGDFYKSEASFTGKKAGTYEITTTVTMTAGNSHVSWVGTDTLSQDVQAVAVLTGFNAKFVKADPILNPKGKITGYNVTYDLYYQYDNAPDSFYQTLTINMSENQTSKSTSITFNEKTYNYTVTRE
jgi:hypothetical protein